MAKYSALGLARDMLKGREETILTPKQANFLRDICAKEVENLERRKYRAECKKAPSKRRFPVVASVGDSVWQENAAYCISGEDGFLKGECYVVARPWSNGYCKLIRSDWPERD